MALLPLFLGCAGVLDLSRATPLSPGEVRFQAGSSAGFGQYAGARFSAAVRAGVSPGLEVGGGAAANVLLGALPVPMSDLWVDAKVRLGKDRDSRLHVALNPRLRLGGFSTVWYPLTVELPLLLGYDFGPVQLVTAPRAALLLDVGEMPRATPQLGLTAGCAFPVTEDLELLPAFGVDWTASSDPDATGLDAGTATFAGGISFIVVIE